MGWLSLVGYTHSHKDLPPGINYESRGYAVENDDVKFLYDLTYLDDREVRHSKQEIFDAVLTMIDSAREYIVIDMFLFNDFANRDADILRDITGELTERLIRSRERYPEIRIDFITDPINTVYGEDQSRQLNALRAAGVHVIFTDLSTPGTATLVVLQSGELFFNGSEIQNTVVCCPILLQIQGGKSPCEVIWHF